MKSQRKATNDTTHSAVCIQIRSNKFSFCPFADAQKPEIVEAPKNQIFLIGSDVTLSCTARGLPWPTIRWIKENASYPLYPNPRARVIQDNRTIRSRRFINRVKMEDYAKYQCAANNSVGRSKSGMAVL